MFPVYQDVIVSSVSDAFSHEITRIIYCRSVSCKYTYIRTYILIVIVHFMAYMTFGI